MDIPDEDDQQKISWDEIRRRVKVHLARIAYTRARRAEANKGTSVDLAQSRIDTPSIRRIRSRDLH